MDFVDKEVKCIDCAAEFVFTAGEQLFFHTKQFQNIPKRCKKCRATRNSISRRPIRPVRPETRATCEGRGRETTVNQSTTRGRPVL